MKSLTNFLENINDGSTLAAATSDLEALLQAVQATGRTGSLTLKLKSLALPKAVTQLTKSLSPQSASLSAKQAAWWC
jgi:hypothetical protein